MAIVYSADGVAGKVCRKCQQWKPVSKFNLYRKKSKPIGDGLQYLCNDCKNADKRAKRAANSERYRQKSQAYLATRREQSNEYQRAWRAANADKVKSSLQSYREKNRTKISAAARARYAANLEHHRTIGRKAYAANREKRTAYSRAYSKAHRDKVAAALNRRRACKYQAEGTHTEAEWKALKARYDYTCLCCGRREPDITLTRDHIIPITQDGSDWITNIEPLCPSCNSSKGIKVIDYRLNWPSDPSGGNPADQ